VTVVAIPLARAKLVTSERAPLPAAPPPVRKIETKGRVFLAAPRTRAVTALPEPEGLPSRSWRGRHHAAMPEPRRFPPPPVRRGARPKLGRQCFIVAGPRPRLFRGGAGAAGSGHAAHPRRGPALRRQHRQAVEAASTRHRLFAEKFMKPAAVEGFGLDTFV
jgi:hypothetical protein